MSTVPKAIAVKRGCGYRRAGGIYAESGLAPDGVPIEVYISDPPLVVDMAALGLVPPADTKIIQFGGVYHVFDVIGAQHYPTPAHFIEEARRYGISRRLPKTLDFSLISEYSRLVLIHPKGLPDDIMMKATLLTYEPVKVDTGKIYNHCPKVYANGQTARETAARHQNPDEPCAGFWWNAIEAKAGSNGSRKVVVKMPAFTFEAVQALPMQTSWQPAIIGMFPISRLAVIEDKEANRHENALRVARRAGVPVELEEE